MTLKKFLGIFLVLWGASTLYAQKALNVEKVSITVSDLEVAVPFYTELLDFDKVDTYTLQGNDFLQLFGLNDNKTSALVQVLQLGNAQIELIEFVDENRRLPIPDDSKSNDGWFQHIAIVVSDMEAAYQKLFEHNVNHVSTRPQTLPDYIPGAAGIKAFYFKDPDGHNLEIIYFPKGKGNPIWQEGTQDLFLGIDHTAIGIEQTQLALPLYTDILGLKVAGTSNNYGYEQEHLNQVFGANLIISGLRAEKGIGVEFLDYIAPLGGRPYPDDSKVTDLWHWHTTIFVDNLGEINKKLQETNYKLISKGIVHIKNTDQLLFRDTDGHAILLKESIK